MKKKPKPLTESQKKARYNKAKGRKLQQWVAKQISELLDIPWGKDELIESRQMSQAGVDIILRGETKKLFPYSIECKSGTTISWMDAVRQARKNKKEGQEWLLFLNHPDFTYPVMMMDSRYFFNVFKFIKASIGLPALIPIPKIIKKKKRVRGN